MASYGGPDIVNEGLIFGYDTGYGSTTNLTYSRLFAGKPVTNLLTGVGYTYGTQNQTYFKSQYGTEKSYIPSLGPVTNHYCTFYNDYNGGSGNCCPSVFTFGGFSVSPNTVYTYQIIYRTPDGYAHPNYMYHYEYGPGGYVTEYGLWDGSRTESLGDGWVHAWGTFTSNANTNYFNCYLFHYQYTPTKIQIAGVSLTQGNTVLRPNQIPNVATTRTATQALIDVKRISTIDLSNMSYSTTGQPTFDGTDDFIDTNFGATTIPQVTLEAAVYRSTATGRYEAIIQNNVASDDALYVYPNGTLGFWPCTPSSLTVPTGQWSYVAVSYNGSSYTYCVNGSFQTVNAACADITDFDFLRIGAHGTGDGERWIGNIAVARVYNRALSSTEMTQNFQAYRRRFGI